MYQSFILHNGLRVILTSSASDVVYAGIALATGTRHELDSESGMAHFVEHMSFKGTRNLSSVQILNRMESVGGDLNAFTGKEETVYYSVFMRQHLRRALPLLLDIVFNSTYPQAELEKEREVVIDEIESYNDSPSELIYDDFEALLFPNHPLGRNILGDAQRLREYDSTDLQSFTARCYRPECAVLFVRGNVTEKEVRKIIDSTSVDSTSALQDSTSALQDSSPALPVREGAVTCPDSPSSSSAEVYAPSLTGRAGGESWRAGGETIIPKHTHQAHIMLGARAYSLSDPRHVGLALLSNLLGGPAMNSRLSLALRERTGLVYTVESNVNTYTDTGVWSVYFGCDHADVSRCLRLVRRELQRLVDAPLSERTLNAARKQLKGQMAIAADNGENMALGMAKQYLLTGKVLSLEERFEQIDKLTPDYLHTIATEILNPDGLTTLIYK